MRLICVLVVLIFLAGSGKAQERKVVTLVTVSDTIQLLNKKISSYIKKSIYLSKQSKRLNRQIWKLTNENKNIKIRVKFLVKDSLELRKMLDSSYAQNTLLIKNYESKLYDMNNVLVSLKDSMTSLQVVKRDVDVIKKYFTTAKLSKRDYDLPKLIVFRLLKEGFTKPNSPYDIISENENQIVIGETFSVNKSILFFKKKVSVYGTYNIIVFSNPFSEEKTSIDLKQSFMKREGRKYFNVNSLVDQAQRENRLLMFIDKIIYGDLSVSQAANLLIEVPFLCSIKDREY